MVLKYFLKGYKKNLVSLLVFKVEIRIGYNNNSWNWVKKFNEKLVKYNDEIKEEAKK